MWLLPWWTKKAENLVACSVPQEEKGEDKTKDSRSPGEHSKENVKRIPSFLLLFDWSMFLARVQSPKIIAPNNGYIFPFRL